MMATHLQQLLQSLCWDTEWNYTVFWKLKHHVQMVLSLEDAYYKSNFKNDTPESKSSSESLKSLHDGHFVHDPLALVVAKMSCNVYSLGDGIVGHVAVSGKHQWIFAVDCTKNTCLSPEICDALQAQFSVGVKTIVVVPVIPHGVVQLGSLNEIKEDFNLLIHIRDLFSSLQESSACHVQNPVEDSMQSVLQMSDTSTRISDLEFLQECMLDLDRAISEHSRGSSTIIPSHLKQASYSYGTSLPDIHPSEAMILNGKHMFPEVIDNVKSMQSVTGIQQSKNLLKDKKNQSNNGGIQNASKSFYTEDATSCYSKFSADQSQYRFKYSPIHPESASENVPLLSGQDFPSDLKPSKFVPSNPFANLKVEKSTNLLPEFNCSQAVDDLRSSSLFSMSSGLHEALGAAFLKHNCHLSWEAEKIEDRSASHTLENMESSLLTSDSDSDYLLEAVVANFCCKNASEKSAVSFSTSESMLTTEKIPEPSISTSHTIASSCYSIGCSSILQASTQNCLNSSDSRSISTSTSASKNTFVRPLESGKTIKKRARPRENPRPRPRDRQLIQDRIKELRELVPSGSKCSIDSLLERTIKHMGFMQSVTKHADKLRTCGKSRGCSNGKRVSGSGCEQGSSWAVEVGSHMKICPIIVENVNVNGQMLIEMLCEDCDYFLEIVEAIRNLGLTILKGKTNKHGDKIWMHFVVEGRNNSNLHRMDVLWSLVQLLQSKATA